MSRYVETDGNNSPKITFDAGQGITTTANQVVNIGSKTGGFSYGS